MYGTTAASFWQYWHICVVAMFLTSRFDTCVQVRRRRQAEHKWHGVRPSPAVPAGRSKPTSMLAYRLALLPLHVLLDLRVMLFLQGSEWGERCWDQANQQGAQDAHKQSSSAWCMG